MLIPALLPTSIQSMRPTKRKIVKTVYTTEIIVDRHEFVESRSASGTATAEAQKTTNTDFVNVPDTEADELPFN